MAEDNKCINELRERLAEAHKEIRNLQRQNDMLTYVIVSTFVSLISCVVLHWKGW